MSVKDNLKNPDVWLRGLFILIFGVILYFAVILVWLVVVFQFVTKLLTGDLNRQVADFNGGLLRYISLVLGYITFQADEKPFPFSPWPEQAAAETAPAPRPRARRRSSRPPARKKETE